LLSNTASALSIKEGGTPVRRLRSKPRPFVKPTTPSDLEPRDCESLGHEPTRKQT
jgi:hypothetical protein